MNRSLTVMQLLPELQVGGVERGTIEMAHALVNAGHRAIVVSAGGDLVEELHDLGATHIELGIGNKRLSSVRHINRLKTLYRQYEVDIVHARSRLPAWLGWLARQRLAAHERPAWVTTVHGPYSVNRYSRIMVSGERVIAISDFIHDYIVQNYPKVDARTIRVIPRGIDTARYSFAFAPSAAWLDKWHQQYPQLNGQRVLALPARLTRWKGQLDFIELLSRLRKQGLAVHGLLIGSAHKRKPQYEAELRAAASVAGVDNCLSFLGQRDDLREILAVSDIAYSLTREPEAFGRTTLEALALGTPVVGYNHGGTGEILRTVFSEGLINTGDIDAAVTKTAALLQHVPAIKPNHAYTTTNLQQATLSVYQEVVGRSV